VELTDRLRFCPLYSWLTILSHDNQIALDIIHPGDTRQQSPMFEAERFK
jgi:hypothetical protein